MLSTPWLVSLVAEDYALTPSGIDLLQSGHNETYAVEVGGNRSAFRVYGEEKSWIRGVGDLLFELDLLTDLRTVGAPVSHPIGRPSGDPLGGWPSSGGTGTAPYFRGVGAERSTSRI